MTLIYFSLVLFFMAIRMPIAFAIGAGSMICMYFLFHVPLAVVVQYACSRATLSLVALSLFMLSGVLMEYGGISRRLVNFASALVGFVYGGLAHVTILASMFFPGIFRAQRLPLGRQWGR